MRLRNQIALFCSLLPCSAAFGIGGVIFEGPVSIGNVPRPPTTVHEGDFNHDGKLDLVSSNGTGIVTVLLQNPTNREEWTPIPVRIGSSVFFTRGGDFDGDGTDDLLAADGALTAFYVRSHGDGTFEKPLAISQARGPRWVATGDWNNDGRLDFATSNLNTSTVTFFVNLLNPDGTLKFMLTQNPPSGREHTMEALDFDGDGTMDIAVGQGLPGVQMHQGQGDGKFTLKGNVCGTCAPNIISCVEYIATGDLNNDGKDDLATTCIDDGTAYVATSGGLVNGRLTYTRTLAFPFATGTESCALGDLTHDGNVDLALVSEGSGILKVFPGKGDGKFDAPVDFAPTGIGPRFLIVNDLDADGFLDVISADTGGATITIFYGKSGERFLQSADSVTGYIAAKGFGVDDFDHDGIPDLFFTGASLAKAYIYLKPGGTAPTKPTHTIDLSSKYSSLAVGDFNGDGVPDLAGTSLSTDTAQVALLNADGTLKEETSFPAGDAPGQVEAGFIDSGTTLDLAIPASGLNQISVLLGLGDGKFAELKAVPTIERPKTVALGDLDGDKRTDLLVVTSKLVVLQYQNEGGDFTAPVTIAGEATKNYTDGILGDLNGDGHQDVILAESRALGAYLYAGRGDRTFDAPVLIKLGSAPAAISLVDIDGDGLLDVTASSTSGQSVIVALNWGPIGFSDPATFRMGTGVISHRIMDLNNDGIVDLLAFGSASSTIRLGHPETSPPEPKFKRGDADGNAKVEITDAVQTLNWLFRASAPLACEDAADTNDDGKIDLTDPIATLDWLFRDGVAPAAPGPSQCGLDPNPDELKRCRARC